jgi:hypothetical protein
MSLSTKTYLPVITMLDRKVEQLNVRARRG